MSTDNVGKVLDTQEAIEVLKKFGPGDETANLTMEKQDFSKARMIVLDSGAGEFDRSKCIGLLAGTVGEQFNLGIIIRIGLPEDMVATPITSDDTCLVFPHPNHAVDFCNNLMNTVDAMLNRALQQKEAANEEG